MERVQFSTTLSKSRLDNFRAKCKEDNIPMKGDKITNRYGGKGVISKVVEDEEKEENDYITCTSLSDSSNFIGYNSTGSTGQKRVYYFETSISEDSLNAVLQKFSDEAGKMSKSTEYDIATINYTLNSHYFENQKDSSKNTIIKSYNLTDKDIIKDGYVTGITDFNIRLKDIIINENTEIPLFNSITIDLIDNEAVVENKTITIPEANIPKVNAYKYIDTLVN